MIACLFMGLCLLGMGLLLFWNDSEHRKTIARQHKLIADQEEVIAVLYEKNRALHRALWCDEEETDGTA